MKLAAGNKKVVFIVCILLLLVASSCSEQATDKEIKKDLTSKVKTQREFIGVRFVVNAGIVSLSGACATAKDRSQVEHVVKGVYAVKAVLNHIDIAPVVIGTDDQLKQAVDSVLKTYPEVQAIVKDSAVQLLGKAESKDQQKLLSAIQTLRPKELQNEVVFK